MTCSSFCTWVIAEESFFHKVLSSPACGDYHCAHINTYSNSIVTAIVISTSTNHYLVENCCHTDNKRRTPRENWRRRRRRTLKQLFIITTPNKLNSVCLASHSVSTSVISAGCMEVFHTFNYILFGVPLCPTRLSICFRLTYTIASTPHNSPISTHQIVTLLYCYWLLWEIWS